MKKNRNIQILFLDNHKALSWNNIYSGVHWAKRKKIADEIHELIWAVAKEQKLKKVKGQANITIFSTSPKPLDSDNIASKVYIDGLKLAGYIVDDTPKYVGMVGTYSRKETLDTVMIFISS